MQGSPRNRARTTCTILMRAAILLLAAACAGRIARADTSADAACATRAAAAFESTLTRRGVSNVTAAIAAGCDGAEASRLLCDVRGSAGPCSANPACPANQITSFGCTPATEADGCCFVDLRKPCDGCELVVTQCLNVCDGPPPPAQDSFQIAIKDAESECVDRAAFQLPLEAQRAPDLFTTSGCDNADAEVVCELVGAFSRCEDLPICAGAEIINRNCTAITVNQSCCTAFREPPCDGCEPETLFCRQECLEAPPFDTGAPAAAGALPVEFGPALACATSAASTLQELAATDPESVVVGCDDADALIFCDTQSSVGSCEDNPMCPADQIEQGRCTAETGPPSCCDVDFARPCDDCDPIPFRCLNICASNVPVNVSAAERRNRGCIDFGDEQTAVRRMDGRFPPSCAAAQVGQPCELEATAGLCSAGTTCSDNGLEVRFTDFCSEPDTSAEEGCCVVGLAPLCPGCDPEPVDCIQTCRSTTA